MFFYLDFPISQDTVLENLPALGKEYRLSLEFKGTGTNSGGMNNVIHFTNNGPAVFVKHDDKKVRKVEFFTLALFRLRHISQPYRSSIMKSMKKSMKK